MILMERHFHKGNQEIVRLCQLSKELYNRCTFLMRKAWFTNQRLPDINILNDETRELECYQNLHNTKTAKQTIRKCLTDWTNFCKALKVYGKDKSKFIKCPKPPNYKHKLAQVIFFEETIKRKPRLINLIVPTNYCFTISSDKKFKQVVITPKAFGFVIEIQYETTEQNEQKVLKKENKKLDKNKICTLDPGLNTLAAITLDQQRPILVNGRILKSINQWYNKNQCKSRLKKRYFRIENYFHHVSKLIVDLCIKNNTGKIVIGSNDGWKDNVKMRKKTKQAFKYLPFDLLYQKIQYKAVMNGIEVVFTEESYTSKASFYDNDPLPAYDSEIKDFVFSGKRKHRGLYVSKDGFAVNADVNGSLNIGRKIIPEFQGIGDRSLVARPIAINPLKVNC